MSAKDNSHIRAWNGLVIIDVIHIIHWDECSIQPREHHPPFLRGHTGTSASISVWILSFSSCHIRQHWWYCLNKGVVWILDHSRSTRRCVNSLSVIFKITAIRLILALSSCGSHEIAKKCLHCFPSHAIINTQSKNKVRKYLMIKGVFAHFFILSPRRKCYKSILFFRSNRVGWVFWPGHLYAPSGTAGTGCPLRAAASPICGAQLRNCCRRTARIPSQRAWHQTGDVVHRTVPRVVGCTYGVEPDWKSGPQIRKLWITIV